MENKNDFDYIKEQFDSFPEITLPASLSAESLWERVDAGELAPEDEEKPKEGRVIQLMRRMRPVLSYAAVFVVMVVVYYSAGLDSTSGAIPAPEAAPQMMMASPDAKEARVGAQPRMAAAQDVAEPAPPMADMPMLADAPVPPPDSSTEGATANPDTSAMMSAEDRAKVEEENRLRYENYQQADENATAMETHLRSILSQRDYGGMYIMRSEDVTLHIWVVNETAVNAAISLYPPDKYNIVTETARCSLEQLKKFAGIAEGIRLNEGETLRVYVSEEYNTVDLNISKAGEDRLKQKISTLIAENGIPSECVTIHTIDPNAPNPET